MQTSSKSTARSAPATLASVTNTVGCASSDEPICLAARASSMCAGHREAGAPGTVSHCAGSSGSRHSAGNIREQFGMDRAPPPVARPGFFGGEDRIGASQTVTVRKSRRSPQARRAAWRSKAARNRARPCGCRNRTPRGRCSRRGERGDDAGVVEGRVAFARDASNSRGGAASAGRRLERSRSSRASVGRCERAQHPRRVLRSLR